MISWRMAAGWVAALVVATVLAWQIVGLADSQVGDGPVAVAPTLTSPQDPASSTSSTSPAASTTASSPTTTTPGATTSSSTASSTSSSASSASPTSSSAATADWSVRTVTTTGGVVVVRYRPGEVELQAATPAPGFAMEIDDAGPARVRVEFESEAVDVRVEVRWEGGALSVDVDD